MSIITKMRKEKAVYWPIDKVDQYGQPTYLAAVEIDVRWEDRTEEFLTPEGETVQSRALVYVDRDVTIGGLLLRGELSSSVNTSDPRANDGAWEIRRFDKLPNLRASEYLRSVFL